MSISPPAPVRVRTGATGGYVDGGFNITAMGSIEEAEMKVERLLRFNYSQEIDLSIVLR